MKYDAIIVLGRGISKEGDLPATSVRSIAVAKDLLNHGIAPRVIFCGKWSRHYSYVPTKTEAEAMRELALKIGISEDQIFLEDQSLDTISNFYYVKKRFLIPNDWRSVLLLTLHKHDERALLMAKLMLDPEYVIDEQSIDFEFPKDKIDYILETEKEKVRILKKFIQDNHIEPGDHEKLFKEHFRYIKEHNIPPTFK